MINRVTVEGNLTDYIDLRQTQSGKFFTEFTLANNEGSGDNKHTEFITVKAWEKTAELVARYCQKGTRVLVEGKYRTDIYEKDGKKNYKTYVLAQNVEFLSKSRDDAQQPLTREDGRDMFGRKPVQNVAFEEEDLPF